jgi:hypothetical protein
MPDSPKAFHHEQTSIRLSASRNLMELKKIHKEKIGSKVTSA